MLRKTGPFNRLCGRSLREVDASGRPSGLEFARPSGHISAGRRMFCLIFKELCHASAARRRMHRNSARATGARRSIRSDLPLNDDGHLRHRFKILAQADHPRRDPLRRTDVYQQHVILPVVDGAGE